MSPSLDDQFHPDDPTKWLWKRLLRLRPVKDGRPPKTKSDKKRIAQRVREYYIEHGHPRKGKPFRN